MIIERGAEWFSAMGTATSKGTKVFALSGMVKRTGLVEVPMGTTLKQVVYDVGGGIPNNRRCKRRSNRGPVRRMHFPNINCVSKSITKL